MIGKRMPKRRDGASVVRQVTQLAAYIDRDVNAQDRGDVVARGQLNLITDVRSDQVAEMAATAMGAPTARSPIEHLVLSWRAGEQPTVRQIEQGLAILLEETGLRGHQVLWTQHLGASGNAHVHALISRVAPDADKPTRVAFFHRAIGRAVAQIEHVQGWQREPGAHHEVFEDRSIGEQHVDRYRTAGRPAPGLQPHRSLPGARGPHQHDRALEDHPGGERRGRSDRDDHRWSGPRLEPPQADHGAVAGHVGRTTETGGRPHGAAPAGRRDPPRSHAGNSHSQIARTLAAVRLRRAAASEPAARPQISSLQQGSRPELSEAMAAARDDRATTPADPVAALAARRLAEIRMRLAHRAQGTKLVLARRIGPGDALPAGAARAEIYRGEESAARRVIEVVGPIATKASSWAALHAALDEHQIIYEAKGSGAVIVVDGIRVKASTCRAASRTRLEKRLGAFEPRSKGVGHQPSPDNQSADAVLHSLRPAPGTDPALFGLARRQEMAASSARSAYDDAYPMLNFAPLLKAAVVGPAPRAAPSARSLAMRAGQPLPRLAPIRQPSHGASVTGPLELYHAALQADLYRVVTERRSPRARGKGDEVFAQDPDLLRQLTPCPMAEIALGWKAMERAGGPGAKVHLSPISTDRHHLMLSGLAKAQVDALVASGFAPALVLDKSDGSHEVVLTTPNEGRPYEQAALAEASEDLRFSLGVARSPYGLRIDDPDHPDTAVRNADGSARRVYAQILTATGAMCQRLGQRLALWIGNFARRYGLGPASQLDRGPSSDGEEQHADAPVYWAHRADLLARWQGRWPDPSRIDALIARRLRGTGHGEEAVATLITACAPMVPRIGRHAWTGYGRRAAGHAFRGDAQDSCWAFDRASPEMWLELERAARKREEANKPKSIPVAAPAVTLPPLVRASGKAKASEKRGVRRGSGNGNEM